MASTFSRVRSESGQALLLVLGMVAVLLAGIMILAAFGQALGGKSAAQRAADLSAMSAARSMRQDYPRLFLPPVLPNGAPNPRHLPLPVYLARARRAAASARGATGHASAWGTSRSRASRSRRPGWRCGSATRCA